jgi:hypothetical protein
VRRIAREGKTRRASDETQGRDRNADFCEGHHG